MTNNFPYKKIKGELYWLDAKSKTGWSNKEEMKEFSVFYASYNKGTIKNVKK